MLFYSVHNKQSNPRPTRNRIILKPYKITIAPFIVTSTSKERLEQEIRDFLENELYLEIPPDEDDTKVTIEEQ